ncbi:MAG: phage tail protein [Micavibrio sp.]|nr:phage tail protein [Micavibrio sp.]
MTVSTIAALPSQSKGSVEDIIARFQRAKTKRDPWISLWQECYDFALPQRNDLQGFQNQGGRKTDHLFDGTALDAVDQLAASLLAELTPPWTNWFGLKPGVELSAEEAEAISPKLEDATRIMQDHFDRSNFSVEIHQCFLDLVTAGTACLGFEEAEPGHFTAFKFSAVPLNQIVLEEGPQGYLNTTYRLHNLRYEVLRQRFASIELPDQLIEQAKRDPQASFTVLEAVIPERLKYRHIVLLNETGMEQIILSDRMLRSSPYINFRWLKSPGEIYGRSPVMKTLPDIKTANKVVELILKNASIAVTGIWQADDDGVLNPANIELLPGTIIPKAVGSKGLTPLDMPSRFDVSELVLSDLRSRIRHSMLTDRLAQINDRRMTATEVLARSSEIVRLLGATYGRLQSELLTPLMMQGYTILRQRGQIPDLSLDGRFVALDYRSPLARAQAQNNVQNILSWVNASTALGAAATEAVDLPATIRFLGEALGVPGHLIIRELPPIPTENTL